MKKIEIKILNPGVAKDAEKMMVFAARLTQKGHRIHNMDDLMELYDKPYSTSTVESMIGLPHPTIQKFGVINAVIVGASRRFLAQITRHQNEVKFMSASLQYSDYSGEADFCVPIDITKAGPLFEQSYLRACEEAMKQYRELAAVAGNDAAGYAAPQGLRNILIISATPYQWKHMISQRTCRRNTEETRYVMLGLWAKLKELSPMFTKCGPFCTRGKCQEGKMACGNPMDPGAGPLITLAQDFREVIEW